IRNAHETEGQHDHRRRADHHARPVHVLPEVRGTARITCIKNRSHINSPFSEPCAQAPHSASQRDRRLSPAGRQKKTIRCVPSGGGATHSGAPRAAFRAPSPPGPASSGRAAALAIFPLDNSYEKTATAVRREIVELRSELALRKPTVALQE